MDFAPLLEPTTIRRLRLSNRFVMAPMQTHLAEGDGWVSDRLVAYLRRRSSGGAAMVIVEYAFVDSTSSAKADAGVLGVESDARLPGLARLAVAIHAGGALAAMQLYHSGAWHTSIRHPAVAPSPIRWSPSSVIPRELGTTEIDEIVAAFAAAAARVKRAGFDLVEIHGAHGYLINGFLSAYSNRRRDGYGGSLEGRARFALEVVDAVRRAVGPEFPISFRLNGEDLTDEGNSLDDQVWIAQALERAGVDLIHVTGGMWQGKEIRIAPMYLPRGPFRRASAAIKAAVGIPVMVSASMSDPVDAAEAVARHEADLVANARQFLADPDWPAKVISAAPQRITPCIRCNECLASISRAEPVVCTVNPFGGRESEPEWQARPATGPKDVVVIGGGPAGLQAAIVARQRGHRVRLIEASGELGGQLMSATVPEIKRDLRRWLGYLQDEVRGLGIVVELGRRIGDGDVPDLGADHVVLATGSTAVPTGVLGAAGREILDAETALRRELDRRPTVVAAASVVGLEVAWWLIDRGSSVAVVWRDPEIVRVDPRQAVGPLLSLLERAGARFVVGARVSEVREHDVIIDQDGRSLAVPAERVVVEAPRRSRTELGEALTAAGIPHSIVGDAATPGRLLAATHTAAQAALRI